MAPTGCQIVHTDRVLAPIQVPLAVREEKPGRTRHGIRLRLGSAPFPRSLHPRHHHPHGFRQLPAAQLAGCSKHALVCVLAAERADDRSVGAHPRGAHLGSLCSVPCRTARARPPARSCRRAAEAVRRIARRVGQPCRRECRTERLRFYAFAPRHGCRAARQTAAGELGRVVPVSEPDWTYGLRSRPKVAVSRRISTLPPILERRDNHFGRRVSDNSVTAAAMSALARPAWASLGVLALTRTDVPESVIPFGRACAATSTGTCANPSEAARRRSC